ncbi:MAG: tyrosine-type recombinase/integrase [Rhodanobacteraceae bacterium]
MRALVHGQRVSGTFDTKAQASAWILEQQAQLTGGKLAQSTMGEAFRKYAREESPKKGGERWELVRLTMFERDPIASCALATLTPADLAAFRDRRLKRVSGASVRREMNLIGSVLEIARKEWGYLRVNPMRDVRRPRSPPSRRRRIAPDEVDALTKAFGLADGLRAATVMQRTGLAFLFALETAMRAGEILGIKKGDADLDARVVHLPKTKNGDARDVPLSFRAVEILKALPGHVFNLEDATRDVKFREARAAAKIENLHFHDSRAEAIWRLSKKFNVLELARIIGHRDLKSLLIYYETTAAELATRLD